MPLYLYIFYHHEGGKNSIVNNWFCVYMIPELLFPFSVFFEIFIKRRYYYNAVDLKFEIFLLIWLHK